MKHLKLYKEVTANVGDYVIINVGSDFLIPILSDFINNNIGKIRYRDDDGIVVKYFNIPEELKKYFSDNPAVDSGVQFKNPITFFPVRLIQYRSRNKKDLEEILTAKKYNL